MKVEVGEIVAGFDNALKRAQEVADTLEAPAEISNFLTGKTVGVVTPQPRSSFGYSSGFGAAWDQMMERRTRRESKGIRSTDD